VRNIGYARGFCWGSFCLLLAGTLGCGSTPVPDKAKTQYDAAVTLVEGLKGIADRKIQVADWPVVTIDLSRTQATDEDLRKLVETGGLSQLTKLDVSETAVGDGGLYHIRGVKTLQTLEVNDSRVTQAGIDELKESLPNLNVVR
jgi:hypothetical protein